MSWRNATSLVMAVTLTVTALGAAACGPSEYEGPKVVMLGFDGMDYGLTRRLMDEGRLPSFSALERQGGFAALGTVKHIFRINLDNHRGVLGLDPS